MLTTHSSIFRFTFTVEKYGNEDGFFCRAAAALNQKSSTALRRPSAPAFEEFPFAVETVLHTKPFAVHKPFPWFITPSYGLRKLLENCPETLHLMPHKFIDDGHWGPLICALDKSLTQSSFNLTKCATYNQTDIDDMSLFPGRHK